MTGQINLNQAVNLSNKWDPPLTSHHLATNARKHYLVENILVYRYADGDSDSSRKHLATSPDAHKFQLCLFMALFF